MAGWRNVRWSECVWEGERGNDRGVGTAWADRGYGGRKGGVGVSVVTAGGTKTDVGACEGLKAALRQDKGREVWAPFGGQLPAFS